MRYSQRRSRERVIVSTASKMQYIVDDPEQVHVQHSCSHSSWTEAAAVKLSYCRQEA